MRISILDHHLWIDEGNTEYSIIMASESGEPPHQHVNPYHQTRLYRFFQRLPSLGRLSIRRRQPQQRPHRTHSILNTSDQEDQYQSDSEDCSNINPTNDLSVEVDLEKQDPLSQEESSIQDLNETDPASHTINVTLSPSIEVLKVNELWGDDIFNKKTKNACRLYFQNVYGLRPTQRLASKWHDCLKVMKYYRVDIFGFTETCLNWSNKRLAQQYKKDAKLYFPSISINHSSNSHQVDSDYLPGGALQVTVGNWTGRIKRHLYDPFNMGRWTGTQYSINDHQYLYIITLYRVGKGEQIGVTSTYTQQKIALHQRFGLQTTATPRLQVFLDLQEYVTSLEISDNDYFILMTDANETLSEDQYGIQEFMGKYKLVDIFTRHHQRECDIASHKLSNTRRIDFIVGSQNIEVPEPGPDGQPTDDPHQATTCVRLVTQIK